MHEGDWQDSILSIMYRSFIAFYLLVFNALTTSSSCDDSKRLYLVAFHHKVAYDYVDKVYDLNSLRLRFDKLIL